MAETARSWASADEELDRDVNAKGLDSGPVQARATESEQAAA